ncbi:hypothetical protein ABK040_002391 [Willaertia magna]
MFTKKILTFSSKCYGSTMVMSGKSSCNYMMINSYNLFSKRFMASITIKVPPLAETILEGSIGQWMKKVGDVCKEDEVLVALETDKVQIEVRSPGTGTLSKILVPNQGDNVVVGQDIAILETGNVPTSTEQKETKKEEIKQTVQKQETTSQTKQEEQHHKREPMIKFRYGKRDEIDREMGRLQSTEIKQPVQQQTITPPSPIQPPQTLKAGVIYHDNLLTLPLEYRRKHISQKEIDCIDLGGVIEEPKPKGKEDKKKK